MSTHCGFITKIKNIRKHSNADRLQVGECFDSTVIVGLDTKEGDIGFYIPSDIRLGKEFAEANNLLRKKDADGKEVGGFIDNEKRNVKAIKLRGEKSDGLFLSLESLKDFTDITQLKVGDMITLLNGVTICEKYIPRGRRYSAFTNGKKGNKKIKEATYPFFVEHVDTEQLDYNTGRFKVGDVCYITLKMHGTSARTAYTVKKGFKWHDKILEKFRTKWTFISGTRRVTLTAYDGGYYNSDAFRKQYHDMLKTKLNKGEEIFYEIVGYTDTGVSIMPSGDNKKLNDPEFIRQYGEKTEFTYGCQEKESNIYVYRMTMTNEDGYTVEYPWELVKMRCEEMGLNYCPEFEKFTYTNEEDLYERANKYLDISDPVGKTHIAEGICLRIDNRRTFTAFKKKGWSFKVLERNYKRELCRARYGRKSIMAKNLTGIKFGRLKVIKRNGYSNTKTPKIQWECLCDCGNVVSVIGEGLLSGNTKSCGCINKERILSYNTIHGQRHTRLYNIWKGIKTRCYNSNKLDYKNYQGKGITVCEEWENSFMNFYNWAYQNGYNDTLTIDRVNNNGNYEPENCRWATRKQQNNNTSRNKLYFYEGKEYTMAQLSELSGIPYNTLKNRIKYYNMDINYAMNRKIGRWIKEESQEI